MSCTWFQTRLSQRNVGKAALRTAKGVTKGGGKRAVALLRCQTKHKGDLGKFGIFPKFGYLAPRDQKFGGSPPKTKC